MQSQSGLYTLNHKTHDVVVSRPSEKSEGAGAHEIEITPEMVRAGVGRLATLQEFQPDRVYVVKEVYRAMRNSSEPQHREHPASRDIPR